MTLIAVYNSDGCVGRCDARCYNAEGGKCTCICGGRNHGGGEHQAIDNTRELGDQWLEQAQQKSSELLTTKLADGVRQLPMFT